MRPVAPLLILTMILGLGPTTACDNNSTRVIRVRDTNVSAEETVSTIIGRTTRTTFNVEGTNGEIDITGVPGAEVMTVSALRRVESDTFEDANAHLAELEVVVDSSSTDATVRTVQPSDLDGRNYIVNYTITVPSDMVVGVTNTNGIVTVQSLAGDVSIAGDNGQIHADAIEGDANFILVNGQIDVTATLASGGEIDLRTTNGTIDLRIPQDTGAELSATWANGSMTYANLTLSGENRTATSLTGTLGDGNGTITLAVVNGTILLTGTSSGLGVR